MGANGKEQAVTFTVNLPGNTETRAIQQGVEVGKGNMATTLIWALYEDGKYTDGPLDTGTGHYEADKKFTATINMVKGLTYKVLFLAYNADNCAFDGVAAGDDLLSLTLKSDLKANQEAYDAFVACHEHEVNAEAVTTVTLTRPFAQVNAATTLADLQRAKKLKAAPTNTNLVIKDVPTVYNVLTGEATNNGEVSYKAAEILKTIDTQAEVVNEGIEVEDKDYYYLTMAYVLAGATATSDKSMHEATFDFYRDEEPTPVHTINIPNLPIQRNWRTNVIGDLLTQGENFQIVIDEKFIDDHNVQETVVDNAEDFLTALNNASEYSKIVMTDDIVLDGGTSAKYGAMDLKEVIIEGSKSESRSASTGRYTLTFKDSYRTYINLNNPDAKIVFNNVNINRETTNTDTHWHNNNMKFCCNAEFNNVDFNKGICFDNAKTFVMNNCSINKGKVATYALFITAGCDVTIDGLSVSHSEGVAGRGIKIVDEDMAEPITLTTLSVSNSKFVTASKAAVLVGSKAGANITWGEGNDISGVAADIVNAVWVDEDYKNIEDVTVTGCSAIVEGEVAAVVTVTNADELKAAITNAGKDAQTIINLKAGTYAGAFDIVGKNVLLMSTENAVIDGLVHALDWSHVTLRGLTLTNATPAKSASARHNADYYCLGSYVADWVIEDCTFNVNNSGNAAGKGAINIYANRSDWETSMIDGVQYDLVIKNCTFNCNGERPIRGKTNSWVEGCTFNDQHRYAIQVQGNEQLATENVTFINNKIVNPTVTSGEPFAAGGSISKSQLIEDATFNISGNTMESDKFSVLWYVYDDHANVKYETFTVNGATFYPDSKVGNVVATQEAFTAALSGGKTEIVLEAGKTFNLGGATIAANEVTITGLDKETSVINMNKSINQSGKTLNLKDLTYTTPKVLNYDEHNFAFIHYINLNMDNCIVKEGLRLNVPSANITNCEFIQTTSSGFDGYPLFYYGADNSTVKVQKCTFNTVSKGIVIYSEGAKKYNLVVDECTFAASKKDDKAAIQMHTEYGINGSVTITKTTATGFADVNGGLWNELNNQNATPTDLFDIKVDGELVH